MKKTTPARAPGAKKERKPSSRSGRRQQAPVDDASTPGTVAADVPGDEAGEAAYGLAERRAAGDGDGPDAWLQADTRNDPVEQADQGSSAPADESAEPDTPD